MPAIRTALGFLVVGALMGGGLAFAVIAQSLTRCVACHSSYGVVQVTPAP